MPFQFESFDGLALPTNIGDGFHDIGTGPVVAPLISLPGGLSYDPLGSGVAKVASYVYRGQVLFVGADMAAIQASYKPWQAKKGVRGLLTRLGADGTRQTITARLLQVDVQRRSSHVRHLPLTLSFQAHGFPWTGAAHDLTQVNLVGTLYLPRTGAAGPSAYPVTLYLTNGGNVATERVTFTITAGSNSITAVTLNNTTTGYTLAWSGTLATTKSLVIDCAARKVTNDGANAYGGLTPPANHEEWMLLNPGDNAIALTITTAGTGESVRLQWSDAWA